MAGQNLCRDVRQDLKGTENQLWATQVSAVQNQFKFSSMPVDLTDPARALIGQKLCDEGCASGLHRHETMTAMRKIRMMNPAHPGGFVKSEIIQPLDLSVTRAAEVLGVSRAALSALLNERSHLSPEMALRLEKAFGVSMDTLMRMQNSYDIVQTRRRSGDIIIQPFTAALRS